MNKKNAFIATVQFLRKMVLEMANRNTNAMHVANNFQEVLELNHQFFGLSIKMENRLIYSYQRSIIVQQKQFNGN